MHAQHHIACFLAIIARKEPHLYVKHLYKHSGRHLGLFHAIGAEKNMTIEEIPHAPTPAPFRILNPNEVYPHKLLKIQTSSWTLSRAGSHFFPAVGFKQAKEKNLSLSLLNHSLQVGQDGVPLHPPADGGLQGLPEQSQNWELERGYGAGGGKAQELPYEEGARPTQVLAGRLAHSCPTISALLPVLLLLPLLLPSSPSCSTLPQGILRCCLVPCRVACAHCTNAQSCCLPLPVVCAPSRCCPRSPCLARVL